eukprot:4708029-Pyramimonas_sp.AAC.1
MVMFPSEQSLLARGMAIEVLPIPPALSTRNVAKSKGQVTKGEGNVAKSEGGDEQEAAEEDDAYALHAIRYA